MEIITTERNRGIPRYEKRTTAQINSIIVHTTGGGPARRAKQWDINIDDAAVRIYRDIMDAGAHYVIGLDGRIWNMCPLDLSAWHTGSKGNRQYNKGGWAQKHECSWWHFAFPLNRSPLDFDVWEGESANANSIGIELVQDPKANEMSISQRFSLVDLVESLRNEYNIPLNNVYSHAEVHPISRTSKGVPWDIPSSYYELGKRFAYIFTV